MPEVVLGLALALALAITGGIWWSERDSAPMVAFSLRFPADLNEESVVQFVSLLAGLPHGNRTVFELEAAHGKLTHHLLLSESQATTISKRLSALVPGIRIEQIENSAPDVAHAFEIRDKQAAGLQQNAAVPTSTALLAGIEGLQSDEKLIVQWLVVGGHSGVDSVAASNRDQQKVALPTVRACGRVGVVARSGRRRRHLVGRITDVYRALGLPGSIVHLPQMNAWSLNRRRKSLLTPPIALNSRELSSLIGWPLGEVALAGVSVSGAPLLRVSDEVPRRGRCFGQGSHPLSRRSVAQSQLGALSHTLIAGPSGVGKTSVLTNMLLDDLSSARAVIAIDGKGDLARAVLERMPDDRLAKLHVLDLGYGDETTPVPGLSLFGSRGDPELAADLVLGVLADLFAGNWGPRSEQWLRVGLTTIASDPHATLIDLLRLFVDDGYRRMMTMRTSSPILRAAWAQFESMSIAERAHVLSAPLNKLDALLGRSRLRAVLGQADPAISVERIMNSGGTLVVNLATGAVGTLAARLMGALVAYEVYRATAARSRLPESRRQPCMVAIDEPRTLTSLPVPLDVLFEQARGLGVGLSVATQSLSQLPDGLGRAITSNVGTIAAFRQNSDDAVLLARYFEGVSAGDLAGLEQFEILLRLGLGNGRVVRPLTLTTEQPKAAHRNADELTRDFAQRVGRTSSQVDRDSGLDVRGNEQVDSAVGRRRRAS